MEITDASKLCLECGLCCSGILHAFVHIQPEERDYVQSLGISVQEFSGSLRFDLPCMFYKQNSCSIYLTHKRPNTCGKYACQLLSRMNAGDISLEEALARVATVKNIAREVESGLPGGYTLAGLLAKWEDANENGESLKNSPAMRLAHQDWLMAVGKLIFLLRRHFDFGKKKTAKPEAIHPINPT